MTGPGGARFSSPTGGRALKGSRAIILPIDELKTTYVYLRKPRAGTWRITPQGTGAGIRRIETARELPKPSVRARVTRKGAKVQVTWRSRRAPGRKIELVDRAADGTATTIQKSDLEDQGPGHLHPRQPAHHPPQIEAVMLQDGSPRPPLTAARYRLKLAAAPRPRHQADREAQQRGPRHRLAQGPPARNYLITVKAGAEVLTRTTTTRLRLTYAGAPAGTLTIEITPRDSFGRSGPTTRLRAR